jgi:hypothetical protein
MTGYQSFRDLIAAFPTQSELAACIGTDSTNVRMWRHRNSIPARYWARVASAASDLGVDGVTADTLAALAERQRESV